MGLGYYLLFLVLFIVRAVSVDAQEVAGDVGLDEVGKMVGQVVQQHLTGCHLVLLTTTPHSPLTAAIFRHVCVGAVIVAGSVWQHDLPQGVWGDTRTTCRALIIHINDTTNTNTTEMVLSILEHAGLWKLHEMRVVVVGGRAGMEAVLLHPSLRNAIHVIYLALHHAIFGPSQQGSHFYTHTHETKVGQLVKVYRRCLYCNAGKAAVAFVTQANITLLSLPSQVFNDQMTSLNGHRLRVITLQLFPYIDFSAIEGEPQGGRVTPKDSLDYRMLAAFAEALNFTYEYWAEPNRLFGDEKVDGQFTGMVGQLQREECDLTTIIAPTPGRTKAVEFLRLYPNDVMVVTSLKPALLPAHLALVRPFSSEVWLGLLVGVVVWGMILWALQKAWVWVAGGRSLQFSTAIIYGWGALLDRPPLDPSVNISGRMLVGCWLLFCLIISSGFRSSLISHLTVKSTSKTIETLRDLVERDNWAWSTEGWFYNGAALEYFTKHTDPIVQQVREKMQVMPANEVLGKVLEGGFSFIITKNYITVLVASRYTDNKGQTPFYISKQGSYILPSFGWSMRKGSPFYKKFQTMMHCLDDTGLSQYWTDDVIARRVRQTRAAAQSQTSTISYGSADEENREVVLGLNHLQGAFYLLFLGSTLAALTLLAEASAHSRS